mmetsp:Transcript_16973/g.37555  ORF Transcript_16973/g.37555 Transcript_16973/m.37555 type:complete len:340 (-) Transcript_16973:179-1198(-)
MHCTEEANAADAGGPGAQFLDEGCISGHVAPQHLIQSYGHAGRRRIGHGGRLQEQEKVDRHTLHQYPQDEGRCISSHEDVQKDTRYLLPNEQVSRKACLRKNPKQKDRQKSASGRPPLHSRSELQAQIHQPWKVTSGSFDSFRVRFCSFDSSVASELCDAAKPAAQTNRLEENGTQALISPEVPQLEAGLKRLEKDGISAVASHSPEAFTCASFQHSTNEKEIAIVLDEGMSIHNTWRDIVNGSVVCTHEYPSRRIGLREVEMLTVDNVTEAQRIQRIVRRDLHGEIPRSYHVHAEPRTDAAHLTTDQDPEPTAKSVLPPLAFQVHCKAQRSHTVCCGQ